MCAEEADASSALGLLALVAGQDVEQDDDGTWKIARNVARDRVISTVDPEARHMHKSRSEYRDGYKAHIAIEPETGLVTAAALTPANAPDGPTGSCCWLARNPGSRSSATGPMAQARTSRPRRCRPPPGHQALPNNTAVPGGFHRDDFIVDHEARTVTCPAGHTVRSHPNGKQPLGPGAGGAHSDPVARNQRRSSLTSPS